MSDNYKIEARSHNIVGAFSHNFWVLKGPDGRVMSELHGMATDRASGEPVPIGMTKQRSLRAWYYASTEEAQKIGVPVPLKSSSGLYEEGQKSKEIYAGPAEDVFGRWKTARRGAAYINGRNLDYPSMGINVIGETINSNSVFTSFGDLMGLPRVSFDGVLEPGNGNPAVDLEKMKKYIKVHEGLLPDGILSEDIGPTLDLDTFEPVRDLSEGFGYELDLGPLISQMTKNWSGGGKVGSGFVFSNLPNGRVSIPWVEIGGTRRQNRSAQHQPLQQSDTHAGQESWIGGRPGDLRNSRELPELGNLLEDLGQSESLLTITSGAPFSHVQNPFLRDQVDSLISMMAVGGEALDTGGATVDLSYRLDPILVASA